MYAKDRCDDHGCVIPPTRYITLGDLRIAYQTLGDGPVDLVLSAGSFNHTDVQWEDPAIAVFFRRIATFSRLIRFDVVGAGGSDRPQGASPGYIDQLRTVLGAVEAEQVALIALLDAGPGAIEFAVTEPDRVSHLILYNTTARLTRDVDYEIGLDDAAVQRLLPLFEEGWGTDAMTQVNVPSRSDDTRFRDWYAKYLRSVGTPTEMSRILEQALELDVRQLMVELSVPTLVLHRRDYALVPRSHGEYLAAHIPGAEYVELPGADGPLFWDAPDITLRHFERFIRGDESGVRASRAVLTLLFTDIVRSTERVGELGDRDWSAVLGEHDDISAKWTEQFAGRVVKSTGDGMLAVFSSPSDAIRASKAIRDELARMSIRIRSGIHAGEVEQVGDDVAGLAVHIASRIMALAGDGEILVSRAVRDLVMGASIDLGDAGTRQLTGLNEAWQLYRVE